MNAVNRRPQFPLRRVAFAAIAGGTAAAAASTVLFLLLHRLGVDFRIQPSPTAPAAPIPVPSFAVASFLPALIAGVLLMLLGCFTTKARTAFVVIACAFAVLSLAGPATIGGASTATRMALMLMHLVAAVVISGALMRSAVRTEPREVATAAVERA
jgi:Family of unknown function (DUF6069)